jgi:dihydrofolate reductase
VRKLVVSEFVSLDGVMEDPGGAEGFDRGGWALQFDRGDEGDKFKFDELAASDALLLGRVTYEGFAAWPQMAEQTGEYGARMNGNPKYVVSTTLENAEWNNSTIIKGNVVEEVSGLKRQPGKDILVFGSGDLVTALMEHDLIDEYRLMVFPVVLGSGQRLFGDGSDKKVLRLVETKTFGPGVVLTYQPAGG